MFSRSKWVWTPLVLAAVLMLAACGGGDSTTTPGEFGPAFNLFISTDREVGASPLTVTFSAVPSGGHLPYTYAWDFNADGVIDSNAAEGQYTYETSTVAAVTVTDADGQVVTASRTITITGDAPVDPGQPLDVRFNAMPQVGNVPFNVQFTGYVTGGKPPYQYSWDFEGDGVYDSFIENPLYTYEEIGQQIDETRYVFHPVLRVQDNRGVVGTNFDDQDGDGNPDFKIQINAAPPLTGGMQVAVNANPLSGQAPLTVEFTGAVTGGSGDYEFTWNFGDGFVSDALMSSMATHTYLQQGVYQARVTVLDVTTDQEETSYPLTITASPQQEFSISITSDIVSGQVPFVVNFEAWPVNGMDPIQYEWDVFTDTTPAEEDPTVGNPPGLVGAAVVTPDYSNRVNPAIHFGNTAGTGAAYSYVARVAAHDANGNDAVSNLIRIVASPNTALPFYECERPMVMGSTIFPVAAGAGESADAIYQPYPMPVPWAPRANAATTAHPTGITFIVGGEHLDENGNFESLVDRGDSMYMFIPATAGTGTGEGSIGKFNTGNAGYIIHLNDDTAPAFPSSPQTPLSAAVIDWRLDLDAGDTAVPWPTDPDSPPASAPPRSTQRSAPFTIVGSAAAVYINERPETNPAGAYPGPGYWASALPPIVIDRDLQGLPDTKLWPWPDQACHGWGCDAGG